MELDRTYIRPDGGRSAIPNVTEEEAREMTRALYRQFVDVPGSQINGIAHAERMADEEFPNLWKNVQGIDRYNGDFHRVLAEHAPTARERAGIK